jgi:protein angel
VATTHLIYSPEHGDVKLAQIQKLLANIDRIAFKRIKIVDNEAKIVYYPVVLCGDMNLTLNSQLYKFIIESELVNYEQHSRKFISGQIRNRTSQSTEQQFLRRPIIPQTMQINDHSIFSPHYLQRVGEIKNKTKLELKLLNETFGSENLFHTFKFKSAYDINCFSEQSPFEVTTALPKNHEKVDYIFYNGDDEKDEEDNDSYLKLNSVLNLFQKEDVENLYFPSRHIPSDHFLLSAKFTLLYKSQKSKI